MPEQEHPGNPSHQLSWTKVWANRVWTSSPVIASRESERRRNLRSLGSPGKGSGGGVSEDGRLLRRPRNRCSGGEKEGSAEDPGLNDGTAEQQNGRALQQVNRDEGAAVPVSAPKARAEVGVTSRKARRAMVPVQNEEFGADRTEQANEADGNASPVGTETEFAEDGTAAFGECEKADVVTQGAVRFDAGESAEGPVEGRVSGAVVQTEADERGLPTVGRDNSWGNADVAAREGSDVAPGVGPGVGKGGGGDVTDDGGADCDMEEAAKGGAGRSDCEAAGNTAERGSAEKKTSVEDLSAIIEREIRERERVIEESAPPGGPLPLEDGGGDVLAERPADVTAKTDGGGEAGSGASGKEQVRGSGSSSVRKTKEEEEGAGSALMGEGKGPRPAVAGGGVKFGSGTQVVAANGEGEEVARSNTKTGAREAEARNGAEQTAAAGVSSPAQNGRTGTRSTENGGGPIRGSERTNARMEQPQSDNPAPESGPSQVPQQTAEGGGRCVVSVEGAPESSVPGDATCLPKNGPETGPLSAAGAQQFQSGAGAPPRTAHPATRSASERGAPSEQRAGGGSAPSPRGLSARSEIVSGANVKTRPKVVVAVRGLIEATQESGRAPELRASR
ncbi:hypothetical protein KFL_004920055 [Klebsormidium nitens]|uniref:Uncharacterized protein n=1 Tax=Klebsormidium nitens TaxID=105231 RepID=A0A1Y1IK69_KLENI|nr:hypothetical protein KFL_004920055 [Klebsormidium nitens]|eukprot:GAQ89156.1 hypothetical protein KFL_004920055 [Klebsormidium nitens]